MNLQAMLSDPRFDLSVLTAYLDDLPAGRREEEVLALDKTRQKRLFHACAGYRTLSLEDVVPSEIGDDQEVVHKGRNTLPLFRHFAKVFCRPSEGPAGELWGYNRNVELLETAVGPGYFILYQHHVPGELLVDYLHVPPRGLSHWPPVLDNAERLSKVVYNGTQDVLRGVSQHVMIGQATRGGKPMEAYFVLCRQA